MKYPEIEYHHVMPIQLRWMDADAFGHVNNTMYFQYYDTAKMDYFRKVCPDLINHCAIVTVHLEADFMHQVFTKVETVNVETSIVRIGHTSFTFQQRLVGIDGEVKCVGQTIMVLYDVEHEATIPFKSEWRKTIEAFEGHAL